MMGIGFTEMVIIAGIALVVIGPEKFPDFAKLAIRTIRDLRGYMDEIKMEVGKELKPLKKEMDALSKIDPEKYIDSLTAEATAAKPVVSPNLPVSPEDQKVMAEAQSYGEDSYAWRGGEEGLGVDAASSAVPEGTVAYGSDTEVAGEAESPSVEDAIGSEFEETENPAVSGDPGEPDVWTGR